MPAGVTDLLRELVAIERVIDADAEAVARTLVAVAARVCA